MLVRVIRNQLAYVFATSVSLPLRLALGLVLLAYVLTSGVLGFVMGPYDYNHLSAYYEIAFRFWRSGQWIAGFDPFLCGGRTLAADPQVPLYHPVVFLVWLLGPIWALRLEMLAVFALGIVGMIRWLRWFGLTSEQVAWGTLLYSACGAIVGKFLVGHVTLDFYFLFPWIFYLSYRLSENRGRRFWRILAVYCAVFCYAGLYKPNFLVYALLPLGIEVLVRSILRQSFRPFGAWVLASALSILVQAVSALPAWNYFQKYPRPTEHAFVWAEPYAFFANLLLPLKTIPKALYGEFLFLPHEANLFIGPVALVFAYWGIRRRTTRQPEKRALMVFLVFSLLLGLGAKESAPSLLTPFTWFADVWPGFNSIRVPVRFWFGTVVVLIALSAMGWRKVSSRPTRALVWIAGTLPLVVFALFHLLQTSKHWQTFFPSARQYQADFVQVSLADPNQPLAKIMDGEGALHCVQNLQLYPAQNLVEGPLLSTGHWNSWSSAAIALSTRPGAILSFNMNHSDYWQWRGSPAQIISHNGERLALRADSSELNGELVFEDPFFKRGLALSLTGWLLLAAVFAKAFRRRPIYKVALAGEIAAGKSTLARFFAENGLSVIDMDGIARKLREDADIVESVRQKLPAAWDTEKKTLRAEVLRQQIQTRPAFRAWYEGLMHRKMRRIFERTCQELESRGALVVICEGSLLLQTGYAEQFDELIVVEAPREQKLARLQARNPSWPDAERRAWLGNQPPNAVEGFLPATIVVNSGSESDLQKTALHFLGRWASGKNPVLPFHKT